jgi:hypothetical protein
MEMSKVRTDPFFRFSRRAWRVKALCVVAALLALAPAVAFSETIAPPALTKDRLVGTWEAVVQRDPISAAGVYQMALSKEGIGYLVEVLPDNQGVKEGFFARLATCDLADGKIAIRFTVLRNPFHLYDWVEIQGSAVGQDEYGTITGKIIMHSPFHEESWPIYFQKGLWIHYLEECSKKAKDLLQQEQSKG